MSTNHRSNVLSTLAMLSMLFTFSACQSEDPPVHRQTGIQCKADQEKKDGKCVAKNSQDGTKDTYDADGYDADGYDRQGYNRKGFDEDGFDRQGYDKDGYDAAGKDRDGKAKGSSDDGEGKDKHKKTDDSTLNADKDEDKNPGKIEIADECSNLSKAACDKAKAQKKCTADGGKWVNGECITEDSTARKNCEKNPAKKWKNGNCADRIFNISIVSKRIGFCIEAKYNSALYKAYKTTSKLFKAEAPCPTKLERKNVGDLYENNTTTINAVGLCVAANEKLTVYESLLLKNETTDKVEATLLDHDKLYDLCSAFFDDQFDGAVASWEVTKKGYNGQYFAQGETVTAPEETVDNSVALLTNILTENLPPPLFTNRPKSGETSERLECKGVADDAKACTPKAKGDVRSITLLEDTSGTCIAGTTDSDESEPVYHIHKNKKKIVVKGGCQGIFSVVVKTN